MKTYNGDVIITIENSKEFLELEKKLSAVDYSDLTFALFNGDKEKTQEILKDYKKYLDISRGIRNKLIDEHSYEVRLKELIKFV